MPLAIAEHPADGDVARAMPECLPHPGEEHMEQAHNMERIRAPADSEDNGATSGELDEAARRHDLADLLEKQAQLQAARGCLGMRECSADLLGILSELLVAGDC